MKQKMAGYISEKQTNFFRDIVQPYSTEFKIKISFLHRVDNINKCLIFMA
jgi:hypothetical protein